MQGGLKIGASAYGWITFAVAIAYYLGASINRKNVGKLGPLLLIKLGLLLILLSGVGMLIFALLSHHMNLYIILAPVMVATFGQALIFSNCIAGALKDFRHIAGTAAAFFSCLQMLLAAVISWFVSLPHETNQILLCNR